MFVWVAIISTLRLNEMCSSTTAGVNEGTASELPSSTPAENPCTSALHFVVHKEVFS
jgi:hypothetical protein